jgi:predicted SAM-dependent methyltransferase
MLGGVADQVGRVIGKLKRRRRVKVTGESVRVNIGAGIEVAPGWINVDGGIHALFAGAPAPVLRLLHRSSNVMRNGLPADEYVRRLSEHRFVHRELEDGLPFETGAVDYIFCSHVLEHFYKVHGEQLLKEMHRVLRPGGVVRICVPDLAHAVSLYTQGRKWDALHYFFVDSPAGYYRQHRYLYDFELLKEALATAGFGDIRRCEFRQGRVPDLELLDNRPEETLYVEASRTA